MNEAEAARDLPVVLAAEDDEDVLALLVFRLERSGYSVLQARDGEEALNVVRAAAAESLGVIGSRAAAPELLEVARTDEFRPAHAAAEALARIDPRGLAAAAAAEPAARSHLHEAADLRTL